VLRRRADFQALFEGGRKQFHRHLTLLWLTTGDSARGQIAFIIPKKTGGAVLRNKLRRRMREIYRRELQATHPGGHVAWLARFSAATLSFDALRAAMHKLWPPVHS
jgi:ribonuclease P protein component